MRSSWRSSGWRLVPTISTFTPLGGLGARGAQGELEGGSETCLAGQQQRFPVVGHNQHLLGRSPAQVRAAQWILVPDHVQLELERLAGTRANGLPAAPNKCLAPLRLQRETIEACSGFTCFSACAFAPRLHRGLPQRLQPGDYSPRLL